MAKRYADSFVGVLDGTQRPPLKADGRRIKAGVGVISAVTTLASQAAGDTIVIGKLPTGSVPLRITLLASASLGGTATIAIGTTGAVEKYRAAATFTAVDTPTDVMKAAAAAAAPLTAEEEVFLTIAAAALPSSGTLVTIIEYASAAG